MKEDKTEQKKIEKYAKNEEKSKNYTSTYYFVDEHTYLIRKKKKERKLSTRKKEIKVIKSLFGTFEK